MLIEISDCKNIKKLKLVVKDKKINVVVGNSGSGKSTIVQALSAVNLTTLQSVYTKNKPQVTINGESILPKFKIFNEEYREKILIKENSSSGVYDIFVGDSVDFLKYKVNLDKALNKIKAEDDRIVIFKETIAKVEREIMKRKEGTTLPTHKSKLKIFEDKLKMLGTAQTYIVRNLSSKHFAWIKQGGVFRKKHERCPYCNRKLTETAINRIEEIKKLDEKEFGVLENAVPLLRDLKIKEPNFFKKRDREKLKKAIIEKIETRDELNELTKFLETSENITFKSQRNIKKLMIKKIIYNYFPDFKEKIIELNEAIEDLNKEYNKCISAFNKEMIKSSQKLNSFLRDFGIPYEFKISEYSASDRTASYVLSHIADPEKSERTFGLSSGEKNIVSLLLFLNRINEENIIIDDPASSFDEYKRKSIYELIIKECKKKTVLLFSHDLVFAKFFAFDLSQGKNLGREEFLGALSFLENYDYCSEVIVKEVKYSDFLTISEHITNFLSEKETTYLEKIILLRILFESRKRRSKIKPLYKYLSGVLHEKSNKDIINNLSQMKLTEEDVLNNISEILNSDYDFENFVLEKHEEGLLITHIDNEFIKLMKLREGKSINNKLKKELSSIIHLNEAHVLQLNPLKFNYFSKQIHELTK